MSAEDYFQSTYGLAPIISADVQSEAVDNQTQCTILLSNYTNLIFPETFGGIPTNIVVNLCSWMVLLILFTFLRKRAWDYGRLALVQKTDQRWTQVFYGKNSSESKSQSTEENELHHEEGAFSWIVSLFRIKDEQILKRNGPDAVQYLSFQRHIITYLIIVCAICLFVILPVNYQGKLAVRDDFGRTTISNLEPESQLIWIHIAFSFIFVPLGIILMRHFSSGLELSEDEDFVNRTLMISKIGKNHCMPYTLGAYLVNAYPDCVMKDLQFAYDMKKLTELYRRRETAANAKLYCENYVRETGERLKMRPYRCGRICICPQCPQVDALEYYTKMEQTLSEALDIEITHALRRPIGIAFVTFENEAMAENIYKDKGSRRCSYSDVHNLQAHKWSIQFAPAPENIYWENLSSSACIWYLRAAIINLILFLLFLFLTTPTVILNALSRLDTIIVKKLVQRTPLLSEFLPTFLLLVISVMLPVIVRYSEQFMSHWTRSARNLSIMMKTFIFLLFMVVILPLLQLTSVEAFLEWTFQKNETYRWKCVFMSGNGAFFVNYVITTSFIGTALELIRFPELLVYLFYMCFSRSVAEQAGLKKAVVWEYEFGVQYAWFLLIFAVVIIHSLAVPVIAPFGVLCLCMKHCIDRYNIFYVYGSSKISRNIHAAAINLVFVAVIVMQLCLFFFQYLRYGWSEKSVLSLGICVFTAMICLAQVTFHWFEGLSPIAYKTLHRRPSTFQSDQSECDSVPDDTPSNTKRYLPLELKEASKNFFHLLNFEDPCHVPDDDTPNTTLPRVPSDAVIMM